MSYLLKLKKFFSDKKLNISSYFMSIKHDIQLNSHPSYMASINLFHCPAVMGRYRVTLCPSEDRNGYLEEIWVRIWFSLEIRLMLWSKCPFRTFLDLCLREDYWSVSVSNLIATEKAFDHISYRAIQLCSKTDLFEKNIFKNR